MGSAWANIAVDLVNVTQTVHRLLDTLGNPSVRPEHVTAVTTTIERMQRSLANMEVERRALTELVVTHLPPGHPGYSGLLTRPGLLTQAPPPPPLDHTAPASAWASQDTATWQAGVVWGTGQPEQHGDQGWVQAAQDCYFLSFCVFKIDVLIWAIFI